MPVGDGCFCTRNRRNTSFCSLTFLFSVKREEAWEVTPVGSQMPKSPSLPLHHFKNWSEKHIQLPSIRYTNTVHPPKSTMGQLTCSPEIHGYQATSAVSSSLQIGHPTSKHRAHLSSEFMGYHRHLKSRTEGRWPVGFGRWVSGSWETPTEGIDSKWEMYPCMTSMSCIPSDKQLHWKLEITMFNT